MKNQALSCLCALFLLYASQVQGGGYSGLSSWQPDVSTAWPAGSGHGRIELRGDYLPDHGVDVIEAGLVRSERFQSRARIGDGPLWIYAPFGNFEDFTGGRLELETDIVLRHGDRMVSLERLVLIPGEFDRIPVFLVHDEAGNHLASITHSHSIIRRESGEIIFHNADVRATPVLARLLDQPALDGLPIGQIWLDVGIDVPPGADLSGHGIDYSGRGLTCATRPWWPQDGHQLDVALIGIGSVAGGGFEPGTGRLKITPSATLKNVGDADVPWFRQLNPASPSLYPHEPRDQHPFLVWNAYRIMDGRIEQLGASGTKHAFLTINVACTLNCSNSNILWPGCEDTYGVGNNDSSTYQAPRDEIIASQGLWESCNSFFDSNCNGSQDGFSGSWNNRLLVDPAELNHNDAQYFLDAWYVIQYDVDIWNTMGYHSINPSAGGSGGYTFNPLGPFRQGPLLEEWVSKNTTDPMEGHAVIEVPSLTPELNYPNNMPQGHLRVLVKVHDLGEGLYRYNYAVMNFDFERGLDQFVVPLAPNATVFETWMSGPPDVLNAPWSADVHLNRVEFSAQQSDKLPWFTLYNFELVTDQAPVEGATVRMSPQGAAAPQDIEVEMLAPGVFTINPDIFQDRFETLP
jgi:hypothetical protein